LSRALIPAPGGLEVQAASPPHPAATRKLRLVQVVMDGSFMLGLLGLLADRGVGFKPSVIIFPPPAPSVPHAAAELLAQC